MADNLKSTVVRLTSAQRQGTLTALGAVKSKNAFLTLGGTAAKQTFTMAPLPDVQGPKPLNHGQSWFFNRIPEDDTNKGMWTMHSVVTGGKMCLERIDTKTGELRMTALTGKAKASQMWYVAGIENPPKGKDNTIVTIQEIKRDDDAPPGAPNPPPLEISWGTDKVVALLIKGAPIGPNNKPFTEITSWDIVVMRGAGKGDDAGVGWDNMLVGLPS